MLLGVHASIAGGLHNAPERARNDYDAEAVQIFTKNQRQWAAAPLTEEDVTSFREAVEAHGYSLDRIFAHGSYLINLANPDDEKQTKAKDALVDELERASQLGILGVCFHPGSHLGEGEEFGVERINAAIGEVLDRAPTDTLLMIENTAGTGNNLGYDPEHLATWLDAHPTERLAVTLDTCHMFAAGYDLRPEAYEETMETFEAAMDLSQVRAWHLNDSAHPLGAKKDRHEEIGEGELGLEAFERLVNDERFRGVPASLETSPDTYVSDLAKLRKVRTVEA